MCFAERGHGIQQVLKQIAVDEQVCSLCSGGQAGRSSRCCGDASLSQSFDAAWIEVYPEQRAVALFMKKTEQAAAGAAHVDDAVLGVL